MALRRGAKKLPMEDVCYYHWPLPGVDKVFRVVSLFVIDIYGVCEISNVI